jgi:hypothetical protein
MVPAETERDPRIMPGRTRFLAENGQTTTEWLMVAGALTAVGIFLLELMSGTVQKFSAALIYSLRTIAL